MANKVPSLFDAEIQAVLRATEGNRKGLAIREAAEAARATDANYDEGRLSAGTPQDQTYYETASRLADMQSQSDGRSIYEHAQDMGAGVMGTFGAIGGAADLGVNAIADGLANFGGGVIGLDATWDRTKGAFERMESTGDYWQSLQSEKSDAFDRISAYRQERAVAQSAERGDGAIGQMMAEFGAAASSYIDSPDQILTDSVAQLPYLLTGGLAKLATTGTRVASPAIAALARSGMSREAATKLVQMGLVGGMQGSIEGSDAAASAYARVMDSQDTFGPGQEGERETAALAAAAKAFGIAGITSAVTGAVASKWDLNPLGASGGTAIARTGDNLVKALQEGVQETIESGTSTFASNYAGNTVLKGEDRVGLETGVGGAAGTGLVVGMGSTVVTNPRSAVDAAIVPLTLAGKAFGYVGGKAQAKERTADIQAAMDTANEVVASATTPAMAAALQAGVQQPAEEGQTVDTPAEQVVLPPEIDTSTQVGLFATGMEYLNGKDMNSQDAVSAFHVLGSVLAAANNIRSLRDAAKIDAADESLTPEARAGAEKSLTQLNSYIDNDKLDKWVDQLPMEDIESELNDLKQNPENFGSIIAHLAAINPLKMTDKLIETALEAKSLPKEQRDSLLLAQELKAAEAELKGTGKPDAEGVTRSMMQTGFPGSKENDSVAGYVGQVTSALAQDDSISAQTYFNRLAKFAQFEQGRAAAFEEAARQMSQDPDSKRVELAGYYRLGDDGKLDKSKPQFVDKKALGLVKQVRKDADAIQKMTDLLSKRTGLQVLEGKASEAAPVVTDTTAAKRERWEAEKKKLREDASKKPEKAAAAPETKPEAVDPNDPTNLSEAGLDRAIDLLKGKRSAAAKLQLDILSKERDRRDAEAMPKAVDKPVKAAPKKQAAPVAAPVDIVIEDDASTPAPATEPAAPSPAAVVSTPVAEVETAPSESKNHFKDLQPSYEAAEGASVAEQNDAKNHLAQSFTTSDRAGLVSKLPNSAEEIGATGENVAVVAKVFGYKNSLVNRLQEKLAKKFPKSKRMAMLNGQNFWKNEGGHSLYATVFSEAGIAYNQTIADVMAWTGIQHLLDMVHPVKWSADKEAAFLATYGDAIMPLLQEGWVPLADQVYQVGQKLQTNLELTPDNTVSLEFTEGTMLALAMDSLGVMVKEDGYNGALEVRQVATLGGPLVNWVKVTTDPDLLHDSARALEGFFPERASTAAGIVGTKPTKVNPFYRGSRQKVGKQQTKALLKMSQTSHKLSPLLLNLWSAIPEEAGLRLFGHKPMDDKPVSLAEIAQDGANKTLNGDLKTIAAHIRAVRAHAEENGVEVNDVESFFEYEMVVNGRAMTKGTSPQSSKLYREMFSTVQAEVDPSKENRGFMMAVAQGFGVKMDKQPVNTSLDQLQAMLQKPEIQAALAAAGRFAEGDMSQLDADLAAFEASGIEMTPHALSAFVHMAEYQKGKPFVSSLSYEIDGLTDGPINLMMMLGLQGTAATMEHWLGLGGLWFGEGKIAVQDKLEELKDQFDGSKDLYEIIAAKASELNADQAQKLLSSVPADQKAQTKRMVQAILHLMHITKLSQSDLQALAAKHSRSFTKKPTQAAGYMQGARSIVNDLANSLTDALSVRIDAKQMTDGDWAAVDMLFGNKLVYSNKKKQHFLIKDPDEFKGLQWEGAPLNRQQFGGLVSNLMMFGGGGLADATMETIGYQRARMFDVVGLVNAHISYAQETLEKAYKAKQDEEVAAGRLHPNQALSKKDEQALIKESWDNIIPHPMLRNTGGLPSSSTTRSGPPKQNIRRVQGMLMDRQNLQVSEASFEDPGVSFAALSVMAAGDGSMMTGFFGNTEGNYLNMFDGVYLDPADIDAVGEAINKEVKQNWEHDYIGAVLGSLKMDDPGFIAWADQQSPNPDEGTLLDILKESVQSLQAQRETQASVVADINSRDHSVSHMAGHNNPYTHKATQPLNSTLKGTAVSDPMLELAVDELGSEANGIRKLAKGDVISLLQNHTFENPVLGGLWKVLAPLVSNDLVMFVSTDRQAMADFYAQSERLEMRPSVDGIAIGDRVYVRSMNAEVIMHELLHATLNNLTATFFSNPAALTGQQREAMRNLQDLMNQFLDMDLETLPPIQQAMAEHVRGIMNKYVSKQNPNAAMQEFLAYGLTNYHVQRTLGNTKSTLGKFFQVMFDNMKKLFGFPNGTQSDSMLAHMFSNLQTLTEEATDKIYPVTPEAALEAVNPELARSFGDVLNQLATRSNTITQSLRARNDARTRMQELEDSNLFPTMTNDQKSAGEYIQAMFAAGLQFKATDNALLGRVVDAVRDQGAKIWRTNNDPKDQADIDLAQARFEYFFENTAATHDRTADILAMALVNPEFSAQMDSVVLPTQKVDRSKFNNWLDSTAKFLYDKMDTGLELKQNATLGEALEVAGLRIRKSLVASVKRQQNNKPNTYRKVTDKLNEGVHLIGEKAGKAADARLKMEGHQKWLGVGLTAVAAMGSGRYADNMGKMVLSLTNHLEGANPAREVIQEMVGTNSDNFKLIQLKGIATRMVSAIRQTFREQVPVSVKSWFKDLTPEQDELLHMVIGKMAVYTLSQDLKDRMAEVLTDPNNAILDAQLTLMGGGNRTKRLLMVKYAKQLGDFMANRGTEAVYRNTRAIAGLAVHDGGDRLSEKEMAALEDLSTLQALSHLTPVQRRQALDLFRNNEEGFWKTTALIHSFHQFDTQRAGENTATLNFQKGWIPVESDGRKKLRLVQRSEVRKAERVGWVEVGTFPDDPNLVYMATTVGKTPTLSGGAIHSVDFHMNGIHFHSGLPTDPSIQTIITNPKQMAEIKNRILNGEKMPYTALYDAAGDVQGFQRLLDPAMMDRHTKTVGRISDAAGIWLGRLHEERVAHGQNQAAAQLLRETWDQGKTDKREKEFVNIRQLDPKSDKVIANVWETLPYHTKLQLESAFADGSKNPPIWIRRDQLNDAIGYHKASVSDFFTGDNRYDKSTNSNVAALSRQVLGKDAYKYLTIAESGWQALIGTAKDTIIVKSLVVALNNLASNQTQLAMITGNPVWNLRVQAQKHKELVSYLGYQQRVARLTAEGLATSDPAAKRRIDAEQAQLKIQMRKLSIYPLIEAGEMPTIAEGLSETEEFSMVGDLTAWMEKQLGKMPSAVGTVANNLAVSKETSLYKGLDRMIQYGDFVAKATMYEWLTTQDKAAKKEAFDLLANDTSKKMTMAEALHQVALMEVNDEFVNYARLPGRWRTYGEDMGLLWFYNYKLRIQKMAFRRMRKNPVGFLIGSQVGGMLGIQTLVDTLPHNTNFAYSTGIDPLFTAHQTILWNQIF